MTSESSLMLVFVNGYGDGLTHFSIATPGDEYPDIMLCGEKIPATKRSSYSFENAAWEIIAPLRPRAVEICFECLVIAFA